VRELSFADRAEDRGGPSRYGLPPHFCTSKKQSE